LLFGNDDDVFILPTVFLFVFFFFFFALHDIVVHGIHGTRTIFVVAPLSLV
jgi:hypothetical protein